MLLFSSSLIPSSFRNLSSHGLPLLPSFFLPLRVLSLDRALLILRASLVPSSHSPGRIYIVAPLSSCLFSFLTENGAPPSRRPLSALNAFQCFAAPPSRQHTKHRRTARKPLARASTRKPPANRADKQDNKRCFLFDLFDNKRPYSQIQNSCHAIDTRARRSFPLSFTPTNLVCACRLKLLPPFSLRHLFWSLLFVSFLFFFLSHKHTLTTLLTSRFQLPPCRRPQTPRRSR